MTRDPDRRRVLVCGGGVAALEAVLALQRLAGERLEIELLSSEPTFVYRALSVGEPFGLTVTPRCDLARLVQEIGVDFRHDAVLRSRQTPTASSPVRAAS